MPKKPNYNQYEVCFVVEGYVNASNEDEAADHIDTVEYTHLDKSDDNTYTIRDGRMAYNIFAYSPEEAYKDGSFCINDESFGDLIVTNIKLEHVSLHDTYWYREDLNL